MREDTVKTIIYFIFKTQLNIRVTQIYGKGLTLYVYIKSDTQLVKNYRSISFLPIFGKNFEKIKFNKIYNFLLEERLLNPNQSGFRPSESCVNQLLATT